MCSTSSIRILAVVAVVALAPSEGFAASLNVASGTTETVAADANYDSVSVSGTLVVNGAKLTSSGALALTGGTVRLSDGATLTAAGVAASSVASRIEFNGGRLVTSGQISADGVALSLVGSGGDVLVDFNFSGWMYAFVASSGGKTTVSGSRKLVLSVKGSSIGLTGNTSYLAMTHTGRTEIRGGSLSADYDKFPNSGELFVAGDAELWIGGMWLTVGSLTGPGSITGRAGGQVKISVPSGAVGCCYSSVASELELIKEGAGVLKTTGTMPSSVTVNGGEVRAVPRSEIGYSQFRFKVDGVGTPAKTGMQLNELAFFAGEQDVTAGYAATSFGKESGDDIWNGGHIFDKKDNTKWWYTYSADPSFGKAWVAVTYPERRIITGYRLKASDTGGDVPKSWRLFGRDAGGEWELIDEKVDDENAPEPGNNWSSEYVVSCAANPGVLSFSSLALANGTTLSAPADTTVSCAALSDGGASYSFAAGSSVDIGVAADCASKGIVGAGAFAKSGAADLDSYGAASPEAIRVRNGTLALRMPIALRQWKLAIGDVYDASGNELALGEFAVYDQSGNRLNVTGSATMESRASSFSATQAGYLYDGKDNNQAWLDWGSLNVNIADDTTWPWTSFTLAEGAPAVAGYNLRTATYVSKGRPKTWKLYARAASSDEWTLVDAQTDSESPSSSYTWYDGEWEWPGKAAWLVSSTMAGTAEAFPAATPVTVDPGATLDLTRAAATQLADIGIDGDAVGHATIRGGACATAGTLRVTFSGPVPAAPYTLPLKLDGVGGTGALRAWTLMANGEACIGVHLGVGPDGMVSVMPVGTVIVFR